MPAGRLNPRITNSQVVVLTGAGASRPLGLWTMREFLEHVDGTMAADDWANDAYRVIRMLRPDAQTDLEALIDAVHEFEVFEQLVRTSRTDSEARELMGDFTGVSDFARSLGVLRNRLRSLVIQKFASVDPVASRKLYQPFWEAVCEADTSPNFIPVFTTNYDWALETFAVSAGIRVLDGFQQWGPGHRWSREAYEPRGGRVPTASRNMALFKLHGSTSWYRNQSGDIEKHQLNQTLDALQNVIIYPGRTKVESLDEPFQTSYQYLAACLRRAKHLIVVGYRFGDLSIQRVIESVIADGSDLRITAINGDSFEWNKLVSDDVVDRTSVINEFFQPPTSPRSSPSYLARMRASLGLQPQLTASQDYYDDGRVRVHYRIETKNPAHLTAFGYQTRKGAWVRVEAGAAGQHELVLQTQRRSEFRAPISVPRGHRLFHLTLPADVDEVQRLCAWFEETRTPSVSGRLDAGGESSSAA